MVPIIKNNIILRNIILTKPNLSSSILRNPQNLRPGRLNRRRSINPNNPPLRIRRIQPLKQLKPSNHPGKSRPRNSTNKHRIKENPHLPLLLPNLKRPPRKPKSTKRMVRRPSRNIVGFLPITPRLLHNPLHGILMLDPEPGRVEPHIRAHQPRQLDVARALVARARACGDGGDLARVVALHAADGDEGRAALGLGVRE
ncbi:inositol-3-phosphate synthase [Penicillium chrysogenum]|nr:inositol-3-phosphate synthase [Penicillium chrysogenum]